MVKFEKFDAVGSARLLKGIWNVLTEEQRSSLVSVLEMMRFRKNEKIYAEGDRPEALLCLVSGKVMIYREGVGGRPLINRMLHPVQYFGYRASMADEDYVTAAAAFEDTTIISVPIGVLYHMMDDNTALCRFFIRELAVDLGIADRRIVSITQKHVRGRLAEALLTLSEIYGMDEQGELGLAVSRDILANMSNMTTSNAIRTLSAMAAEGIVSVAGRDIKLLDIEKLRQISAAG